MAEALGFIACRGFTAVVEAADINSLEVRAFGSMGRVYLGGEEKDIEVGWQAAVAAIEAVEGREEK